MFARFLPGRTPRLSDRTFLLSRPLGSTATPASSGFTATTGRSASKRRIGTQCLRFPPLARSLSRPQSLRPRTPYRRSPSHVPCKSRRPGSRRLHAGHHLANHRDTRQAHHGRTARPPAFDATSITLTTPQQRTPTRSPGRALSGTSSWSPPDASSAPSPCRSPRRSSANAAQGGLTPPPEGRRRRANKPPSLAQHRLYEDPLHQSSFSVRDTRLSRKSVERGATPGGGRRGTDSRLYRAVIPLKLILRSGEHGSSHHKLMHRIREWFVRQPRLDASVSRSPV
jgi:hypothetical protein